MKNQKKFLYLVVIGGRFPKANVEIHDVRWVIGSKIEDTFDQLRNNWFGSYKGLHIDSYKKINSIDGYKINLRRIYKKESKTIFLEKRKSPKKNLWFVNIGGYDPSSMQEKHEFGLVVASSSLEAKNQAISKWLIGCRQKHKDDFFEVKSFAEVDDCEVIKKIGDWKIELTPDENYVEERFFPDWFGYMRIDKK